MVCAHVGTPDCTCTGARDTGRTWHSLQQYAVRLHLEQSSSLFIVLRQSLLSQGRSELARSAPEAAAASPVFDMTASLQRMAARAAASTTQGARLLCLCLALEPASSRPCLSATSPSVSEKSSARSAHVQEGGRGERKLRLLSACEQHLHQQHRSSNLG